MRCTAVPCAEDERDLSKVVVDREMADAVLRGYLEHLQGSITPAELAQMPIAPALLALELSSRFLADFLLGDQYFKVNYPNHNLDRAITQFAVCERFEALEGELRRLTEGWTNI